MESVNKLNNAEKDVINPDEFFEQILHSPIIASGRDGIILKVNISNLGKEAVEMMKKNGIEIDLEEGGYALKMLKVYKEGFGQREYEIQKRAYHVLKDVDNAAKVPKPIVMKIQHLNESDKNYLRSHAPFVGDKVELILMDYIEGSDLATYIYDFILSKNSFDPSVLENMSFEEKHSAVSDILNFEKPKDADSSGFKELYSVRDNMRKIMSFLKKHNFEINKESLDKITSAIRILEENGIFHNDLHERNVILDENGNPFIIDFGRSVTNKSDQESDDMAIVRRYQELQRKETEAKEDWEDLADAITKSKQWSEKIANYKKHIISGNKTIVLNSILAELHEDNKLLKNLATLFILCKEGVSLEDILEITNEIEKVTKREFTRRKISDLKNTLKRKT